MKTIRLFSIILSALLVISMVPLTASAYSAQQAALTFSDNGIEETTAGSGYTVKGTALTISENGTYRVTGSCSEGSITVKGGLSDVTLILDNLTLSSTTTAPVVVKKSSSVLLKLVGTSTLTDNEALDETNSDFEGAAVKVKSGSSLTIFGDGTLKAKGTPKNALKGAAESSLTVDGGTIIAEAQNSGIAFDGSIVINAGTFNITSQGDAIKSQPDEGDTVSAGTVTINGGTFDINAQGDGIVAAEKLTITDGDFTVKTLNGYNSSNFNKDTMSCKGLKASSNNEADSSNPTSEIKISGGTFSLNTADDAVHSDGYVTITGGTLDIYTGDDGVHADSTLTLGTENGYDRDPEITINSSYEGLEGSVVNIYSGKFYVVASDDGVNAAGGSSNGSEPSQGGGDQFRPGQGGQGGPGGQGGMQPGGQGGQQPGQQSSGDSSYSINIYGGDIYVNCTGDGLDSNGNLNLLGGDITVLSMQGGGDNSPLDADGTTTISGATVFAAGSQGMGVNLSSSSQKAYTSSTSYNAGSVLNVSCGGSVVRSEKLVRRISYMLYSSPSMTSTSCSVSTANSVTNCKSNAWAHSYDSGTIVKAATATESGLKKYTCTSCNDTEYKTIPKLTTVTQYVEEETTESASGETPSSTEDESESGSDEETDPSSSQTADTGYTVNFLTNGNAAVNIYYTQDYTQVSESGVNSAVSRSSSTGKPDSSGDGQVNFTVVPDEGYEVVSVTATGSYKNLKNLSDTLANTYRVTKIEGEVNVVITTKAVETQATDPSSSEQSSSESGVTEPTSSEQSSSESGVTEPTSSEQSSSQSGVTEPTSDDTGVTQPSSTTTQTVKKASKKANTITVKTKTVKAKKTKTVRFKKTKVFVISKAQGTLSFTKVSGNKKITINKKTGAVTVKKGLKKGTYTLKVKVKAKGNSKYKAGTRTVKVKVVVRE